MLKEFYFFDELLGDITKILASSFDFAYLIFCTSFGFQEVESITEFEPGKFEVVVI